MLMKIGDLSKKSGVHIETIRYYERMKLLPKPARTEAGQRVYGDHPLKRLNFIRRCRDLDFSLDEIRFLLQTAENDDPSCPEVAQFSEKHLARIREKIRTLKAMERTLKTLTAACQENRTPGCPLIDVLYKA